MGQYRVFGLGGTFLRLVEQVTNYYKVSNACGILKKSHAHDVYMLGEGGAAWGGCAVCQWLCTAKNKCNVFYLSLTMLKKSYSNG